MAMAWAISAGSHAQARLPPGPRRHCALAAPILSVAAARRRLRHLRLHGDPSRLRHAERFRSFLRRGAPPRPARHHRARAQPHVRPASLVPARTARRTRQSLARLLRLERHAGQIPGRPDHLQGLRNLELDLGSQSPRPTTGTASTRISPISTSTIRPSERRCSESSISGSTWASTGCVSTPIPYLYEREGTNCENLPETHAFLRELRAHVDSRFRDRMLLAEANQWPEDAVAVFRQGRRMPHGVPFPVHAAAVHGPPAWRTASRSSTS